MAHRRWAGRAHRDRGLPMLAAGQPLTPQFEYVGLVLPGFLWLLGSLPALGGGHRAAPRV